MDYSTLKSRVAGELNRDDLTTLVATWVNEARKQIADGTLPIPGLGFHRFSWLYLNTTVSLVSGTALYDWPSDCIDEISLFYPTKNKPLVKVEDPAYMDALYYDGNDYDATGVPANYLLRGTQYEIYPIPDAAYTIYLRYYALPAALSNTGDQETIDTKIPEIIISAASLLGAIYLHDTELIDLFMGTTQIRHDNAVSQDNRRKAVNSTQRIMTFRDFNLAHFRAKREM